MDVEADLRARWTFSTEEREFSMKYFSVEFLYSGATNPFGADGDEDGKLHPGTQALIDAERIGEEALKSAHYEFVHDYCWPEGDFYKLVRGNLEEAEIRTKLTEILSGMVDNHTLVVRIGMIRELSPDHVTIREKTVREEF